MKKNTAIILIIILVIIVVASLAKMFVVKKAEGDQYVTSKSSKYCYYRSDVSNKIEYKNKIYYPDIQECGKPFHK